MAKTTLYADRIVNISVTGSLVRLDLAVVDELPQKDGDKVKLEVNQRLVMPLDGFVASLQMQEKVIKALLEKGVLKADKAPAKTSSTKKAPAH